MGSWFSSESEIQQLQRKVDKLEKENALLKKQLLLGNAALPKKSKTIVSRDKLLKWVDEQLERQESNISWIPDSVERQLKADIFAMILDMMDHVLETSRFEFMGHEVRMDLLSKK